MQFINPLNGEKLEDFGSYYSDQFGNEFPMSKGVLRIAQFESYTENFGVQWNKFDKTQLDSENACRHATRRRFFAETNWHKQDISGLNILEVGSGAGRFSKVILENTNCNLYSIDSSDAVTANFKNNGQIAPDRFYLFQASIYEMPFRNNSFDKVLCLGVLQHTPDFSASIKELIDKAVPGGEIVVDFYPINGWWTKLHAKYLLRPVTKRLSHARLLRLIEANIDWLIQAQRFLHSLQLGFLARFLPIVDIQGTLPKYLSAVEQREWAVLDTFDMFSPRFDNPQRIKDVVKMFKCFGAEVTFAGFVHFDHSSAAVVRGIKLL